MPEFSKLLIENSKLGDLPCNEIIHPWTRSCVRATYDMMIGCGFGMFKLISSYYAVSQKLIILHKYL